MIVILWLSIYMKELKNGVNVIVDEMPETRTVSVRVYVKNTGSVYETDFYGTGISHYLEHLISGGTTAKRSEREYETTLRRMGAYVNAYTSQDHTCYYINGSSKFVHDFIKIIYEWITLSSLDTFEVKREKGVITREILMSEKNPGTRIWRRFMERLLGDHPAVYPVIGYEELFKKITRDDLYKFYKERYIPQNFIVAVGGDVDHDEIFKEVDSLFGNIEPGPLTSIPIRRVEPFFSGTREFLEEESMLKGPSIYFGFITVPRGDRDVYSLDMFSYLIDDVLVKELKDKKEMVSNIGSFHSDRAFGVGYFVVYAEIKEGVSPDSLKEKVMGILFHPERYIKAGDVDIKRNKLILSKYRNQRVESHVAMVARNFLVTGDINFSEHWVDFMQSIKYNEMMEVVKRYIVPENCTVVKFVKTLPSYSGKEKEEEQGVSIIELKNGVKFLLHSSNKFPTFVIYIGIKGGLYSGSVYTSFAKPPLSFKGDMKGIYRFEKFMDRNGLEFNFHVTDLASYIEIKGYKDEIEKALDVVRRIFRESDFREKEVSMYKNDYLESLRRSYENSYEISTIKFYRSFYVKHPAFFYYPESSQVEKITTADLKKYYKENILNNSNIVVAVYGDIDKDYVERRLKEIFISIPEKKMEFKREINYPQDTTIVYIYDHPQVNIFIGYPTVSAYAPDYYPLRVIREIFSSSQGRLHRALRGERDLVYFGYGYQDVSYFTSPFIFKAQTGIENYREVIKIILNEVEKLKRGEITREELEEVKTQILNKMDTWYQTEDERAHSHVELTLMDKPIDFIFNEYKRNLERVTVEDVVRVARKYFTRPFIFIAKPPDND